MLETDAKKKWCPFRLGREKRGASKWCVGSSCMSWIEVLDHWNDNSERQEPQLRDPPEGHCGMIPPELNCNVG